MILAADLGNSALTLGLFDETKLCHHFFTATDVTKTESEYRIIIERWLDELPIERQAVNEIILSSVVPPLTNVVKSILAKLFGTEVSVLGKKLKTGLAIRVDHPGEVGSDLVAAAVAGILKYGYPLVIADMGTATKLMAIDASGAFVGVAIAPGLMISLQALIGRASQLADVDLEVPKNVIGRNTKDSVNSGVLYGHAAMVKGLATQIETEIHAGKPLILTGGYAKHIRPLLDNVIYDEHLLLEGLVAIVKKNRGQ